MNRVNQKGISAITILVIVGVLLVGGFFLYKGGNFASLGGKSSDDSMEMSKDAGDKKGSSDDYTGSLQKMMKLGVPLKCNYTVEGNEFEAYIKGDKFKGTVENADGTLGGLVMQGNCMYAWNMDEDQGYKMCLEETESFIDEDAMQKYENSGSPNAPVVTDYNCRPAIISDADLEPPSNVTFMSMDEMMNSMMDDSTMMDGSTVEDMMEN